MAALVGLDDLAPMNGRRSRPLEVARGALALVGAWRSLDDSRAAANLADIYARRNDGHNA